MTPPLSAVSNNNASSLSSKIQELREFLEARPRNARYTSQLAILLAQQAKHLDQPSLREEAIQCAQKAKDLAPTKPFGYAALSVVCMEFENRMEFLKQAIERSQEDQHVSARAGLLVRLLVEPRDHQAKLVRAGLVKDRIGSSSPQHPSRKPLDQNEDKLYQKIRQTLEEAWKKLQDNNKNNNMETQSLIMQETLAGYEYRLGLFFRKRNPPEQCQSLAREHFRTVCRRAPSHPVAPFWLATLQNDHDSPDRCPPEYVVGLYSTFAERFDELLVQSLRYKTPTELRELVDSVVSGPLSRGLDLGCGTGLSGQAFRSLVLTYWKGVDLSPQMVEKAKQRNCYEEAIVGDCTIALEAHRHDLDLIIACDVFCYLGDLKPIFAQVQNALTESGMFAFSTELLLLSEGKERGYVLQACARFAHSKQYIERLAEEHNFTICKYKVTTIRINQGKDVKGQLVALRKKA